MTEYIKPIFQKGLVFLFLGFAQVCFSGAASASVDVRCVNGNCQGFGGAYTTTYVQSGLRTYTECQGSCYQDGWIEYQNSRLLNQVTCLRGGCFQRGWDLYNRRGDRLREVTCHEGRRGEQSCVRYGWTMVNPRTGRFVEAYCREANCFRGGWDIYDERGRFIERALCRRGDCNRYGWTIRRR